jgi:hypothetical protein
MRMEAPYHDVPSVTGNTGTGTAGVISVNVSQYATSSCDDWLCKARSATCSSSHSSVACHFPDAGSSGWF